MSRKKWDPKGFQSVAHRKAVFTNQPELGRAIASTHGALVGGGFSRAQLQRRRSAAGKGQTYHPKQP